MSSYVPTTQCTLKQLETNMVASGARGVRHAVARLCEQLKADAVGPFLNLRLYQSMTSPEMREVFLALCHCTSVQALSIGTHRKGALVENAGLLLKALQQCAIWQVNFGEAGFENANLQRLLDGMWPAGGEPTTCVAFGYVPEAEGIHKSLRRRFKDGTRAQRAADKALRARAIAEGRWLDDCPRWLDPANWWWIVRAHEMTRNHWSPLSEPEFWRSSGYSVPRVQRPPGAPLRWTNPHIKDFNLEASVEEMSKSNKSWGVGREAVVAASVVQCVLDDLPAAAFPGVDELIWSDEVTPRLGRIIRGGEVTTVEYLADLLLFVGDRAWAVDAAGVAQRAVWWNDDAMFDDWMAGLADLVEDEKRRAAGDIAGRKEAFRELTHFAMWAWTAAGLQDAVAAAWGHGAAAAAAEEDEEEEEEKEEEDGEEEGAGEEVVGPLLIADADAEGGGWHADVGISSSELSDDADGDDVAIKPPDGSGASYLSAMDEGAIIAQLEAEGHAFIAPTGGEDSLAVVSRTGTLDVDFVGGRATLGRVAAVRQRAAARKRPRDVDVIDLTGASSDDDYAACRGGTGRGKRSRVDIRSS